jgi:hypothetical protein
MVRNRLLEWSPSRLSFAHLAMDGSGEADGSDFAPKKRTSGNIPNSSRSQRQDERSTFYTTKFLFCYGTGWTFQTSIAAPLQKKCNEWLCYSAALSSAATVIAPDKWMNQTNTPNASTEWGRRSTIGSVSLCSNREIISPRTRTPRLQRLDHLCILFFDEALAFLPLGGIALRHIFGH